MLLARVLAGAAFAALMCGPALTAGSPASSDSLGLVGVRAAYLKFSAFSEVCGELHPRSRAQFDAAMATFAVRMRKLGAEVLATSGFSAMRSQPAPASLVEAFAQDFENTKRLHRSRQPTASGCKAAHDNFLNAPDSHWKSGIASALTELRATGKPFAAAPSHGADP